MSGNVVRLKGQPRKAEKPAAQLSLFDFEPSAPVLFVPMREVHGDTFSRKIMTVQPELIVDTRRFPYFDIQAMSRQSMFHLLQSIGSRYVHLPFDASNAGRPDPWALRRLGASLIEAVNSQGASVHGPFAFMINVRSEAEYFERALGGQPGLRTRWQLEIM